MSTGYLYDVWFNNYGINSANTGAVSKLSQGTITQVVGSTNGLASGVCVDKKGVVYANGYNPNNRLYKIVNGVVASTLDLPEQPRGMCVDKDGTTVWVVMESSTYSLAKIVNMERVQTVSLGGSANNCCVDKDGAIWVPMLSQNTIKKIANGSVVATITTDSYPYSAICDGNNNIYVSNFSSGSVQKIANGAITTTITGLAGCSFITLSTNGAMYVTTYAQHKVYKIINDTLSLTINLTSTGNNMDFVSSDREGNVFVFQQQHNRIVPIINDTPQTPIATTMPTCYGDATGMQWHLLFGSATTQRPQIIMI